MWWIGYLSPTAAHRPTDEAFESSMKAHGYLEGQNVRFERRYTRAGTSPREVLAPIKPLGSDTGTVIR